MSDLFPPGWAKAEEEYLADPRDRPSICDQCDHTQPCEFEPSDCESDAFERAAEDRREADRDARD